MDLNLKGKHISIAQEKESTRKEKFQMGQNALDIIWGPETEEKINPKPNYTLPKCEHQTYL